MTTKSSDQFIVQPKVPGIIAALFCSFAVLLASAMARAEEAAKPAEPAEPVKARVVGLVVGQKAPAFMLKDQHGKDVSLEGLLKKGPVALVFYRSVDWCLFCKFQMVHLQRNLKEFEAVGGQVVGISYDSTAAIKKFADTKAITITMLSDPDSKTIDAYAMRDNSASDQKEGYSAHAAIIVDQAGTVRSKLVDVIYQEQPGIGFLIKALKDAGKPDPFMPAKLPEGHPAS